MTTLPQAPMHERKPPRELAPADTVPEGGYGWVCVACIFLINAHTWGINSAFGVILSFYLSHNVFPGTSALAYAFVSGLSISIALLIAPVITSISSRLSTRYILLAGIIFETASMIGASFATQSWQLFLSQGICFGLGMGTLFISTVGIPNQWFKKRRGIANGIVAAGSGTGGLIYSLATNSMIEQLGLRWSFRILAIIAFTVNLGCGMLIRERRIHPKASGDKPPFRATSLVFQPRFILFLGWGFFSVLGYIALLFSLASYATQAVGLSANTGSLASALLNLGQALGRPLIGVLSDRFGRIRIAALASGLCGLLCLVFWPFASGSASLFAFSIMGGLGAGTLWASAAAIAAELVELPAVPGALSVLWLALVAPGTVAEAIALQLRTPGSVCSPFFPVQMFTGGVYLLAAGCLGLVLCFGKRT